MYISLIRKSASVLNKYSMINQIHKNIQYYAYIYRDPSRLNSLGFPEEIYIGKGYRARAKHHLSRKDKHPFVQRLQSMRSRNIFPDIEIINALDEQHAYLMEIWLILCIGRKDLGNGPLLNLTDGGDAPPSALGRKRSDETKLRMSKSLKGKKGLSGKDSPNFGKHMSPETISKLSIALRGKTPWNKGQRIKGSRGAVVALCKPCTIDGIKIYSSKANLVAELGQGKNGFNHPMFRYVCIGNHI